MTVRGLKPRLPTPDHRGTHQRVRRGSRLAGGERWRPLSRKDANRHILGAKRLARTLRKPGQRHGAEGTLSRIALQVYELLCNLAVAGGGRLEPSIAYMAKAVDATTRSVCRAIRQLKALGFLDWQRRYVHATGAGHVRGPQVEQTTNAYWLALPARALALIGIRCAPAPAPIDFEADRAARVAAIRAFALQQEEQESSSIARAQAKADAARRNPQRDVP